MPRQVAFNDDQVDLHTQLVKAGLNSQSFPDFVKDAFHNKIDALRPKIGTEVKQQ